MSDVAQGGATVFTELGLSVFPVKGAAAFWLNLHASGEGDFATRHAACPVLQGSKWGTSFKQQTFLTNSTANNKEKKKKSGQVQVGLKHDGLRTIIYKNGKYLCFFNPEIFFLF